MKKNLLFTSCGLILGLGITQLSGAGRVTAQAQRRCDYTYITDNLGPDIGKNGKIEYSDEWKAVLEGGWVLKIASGPGAGYIFEKCQ